MTSQNIMKMSEFDDVVYYKAQCHCMDDDCVHTLELESSDFKVDGKIIDRDINLKLYMDCYISDYFGKNQNFILRMWFRIKYALILLFTGRVFLEQYFMFNGEKGIQDYINALEEGLEKLKSIKK